MVAVSLKKKELKLGKTVLVKVDFFLISSGATEYFSGFEKQVFIVFELNDLFLELN